jgi:hypothetical protein
MGGAESGGDSEGGVSSFSDCCFVEGVGSAVTIVEGALLPGLRGSASSGSTKGGKSVSFTGGAGAEGVALSVMAMGVRAEVVRVGAVEPERRPEPVEELPCWRADL